MDLESYNERVDYLRSGVLPSHVGARHQRYRFKQTMKRYSLDHCLRLHLDSRRVLHEEEVNKELKLLHVELNHCNRDEFIRAVRARFSIVGLKDHCRAIVSSCVARLDDLIGFRVKGPMVHYTEERRKVLCRKFGIPWLRHLPTVDYPCLDVVRFKPDTLDTRSSRNCLCSALSAVLSGTPAHAGILEEMVRQERSGPNGHLTVRFDGDLPEGGVDDLFFVTATDTKLLARRLGINIFECFVGRGDDPPCWISYSGNHQGPEQGGVYLAVRWLKKRKLFHSVAVLGLKPIGG